MKNNSQGFTLIELIATIVIIGFVSLMAFPSVMNAVNANKTNSCKYYERSIIAAAKSYIQKENTDLIENNSTYQQLISGSFRLSAYDLIRFGYLENYSNSKTKIDTSQNSGAYVMVKINSNDTYTYTVKLVCLNTKNEVIYSK